MANECHYTMKMIGSKEAVSELAQILDRFNEYQNDSIGDARYFLVNNLEPIGSKGLYALSGEGACARSVYLALQREGLAEIRGITGREDKSFRSIESESERLHVALEVYSSEPQMGFQEHLLVVDGQVLTEDCITYEIVESQTVLENIEAFNEKYGTSFTEQEVEETSVFYIGGHNDRFGDFSALDAIAQNYEVAYKPFSQAKEEGLEALIETAKEKAAEKNAERSGLTKENKSPDLGHE